MKVNKVTPKMLQYKLYKLYLQGKRKRIINIPLKIAKGFFNEIIKKDSTRCSDLVTVRYRFPRHIFQDLSWNSCSV